MTPQAGFAPIDSANMYYEMAGEGHPLVMIHAGIADNRMWDDQFTFFAQQYKVIRFDMRGFGQSTPVAGEFARHEHLRALLDFLHIERAHLMGCSKGGTLCLDFALTYPQRVNKLITVGSSPGGFEFDAPPPPQWETLVAAFKAGDLERVSELETQVWVDGRGRSADQVNPEVRKKVYEMNLIALRYEKMELGKELPLEPPAANRLNELHCPTLVMIGDLDNTFALAAADFMTNAITGARKVVMNGTAHVPNMEKPDEFNQHVSEFLAD